MLQARNWILERDENAQPLLVQLREHAEWMLADGKAYFGEPVNNLPETCKSVQIMAVIDCDFNLRSLVI